MNTNHTHRRPSVKNVPRRALVAGGLSVIVAALGTSLAGAANATTPVSLTCPQTVVAGTTGYFAYVTRPWDGYLQFTEDGNQIGRGFGDGEGLIAGDLPVTWPSAWSAGTSHQITATQVQEGNPNGEAASTASCTITAVVAPGRKQVIRPVGPVTVAQTPVAGTVASTRMVA